jgi:hypothetical protein
MQSKFKTEAGAALTPAKPVNPEDVKLVTERSKTPVTPKALATGKTVKTKTPKTKTVSNADLENAPATEEPGASTPGPTPKTGKSKKHPSVENPDETGFSGATPEPKVKKSKKSKTPSDESTTGDSNLHPFLNGEAERTPKPAKTPKELEETRNPSGENSEEARGGQGTGNGQEPGKTEKKKKKGNGEATPGE